MALAYGPSRSQKNADVAWAECEIDTPGLSPVQYLC